MLFSAMSPGDGFDQIRRPGGALKIQDACDSNHICICADLQLCLRALSEMRS